MEKKNVKVEKSLSFALVINYHFFSKKKYSLAH